MSEFTIGRDLNIKPSQQRRSKSKSNDKNLLLLAKYANVGYYLLTPILMGVFFGLLVDRFLHTKPTFTLVFLVFGFIATLYNLFKLTKQ